jgi:hypothetical protein
VLDRLIAAAGGAGETVPLSSLEAILIEVASAQSTGAWTLARARVGATPERVLIEREPGRDALPVLTLASDESVLWDGRFRVAAGARLGAGVEVRALGVDGLRDLRAVSIFRPACPSQPCARYPPSGTAITCWPSRPSASGRMPRPAPI